MKKVSYLWEAFKTKINMLLLGVGTAASLMVFKNPRLLGGVIIAELIFLLYLSTNKRFRLVARSRVEQEEFQRVRRRLEGDLFRMSKSTHRDSYIKLRKRIDDIKRHISRSGQKGYEGTIANLAKLQNKYLQLIMSQHVLKRYLDETRGGGTLQKDITQLEKEITEADGSLRNVKEQRLDILRKRLSKVDKAMANEELITNQLKAIEEAAAYLLEQILTARDVDTVSQEIEKITVEAETATESVGELQNFIEMTSGLSDGTFGESEILEVSQKIREL